MTSTKRLLIVGGGIAGLTAAWRAQQRGWAYTLVEASSRLGGMVLTDHIEDCIAEAGPESFITRKPQVWQLANELGLRDQIVPITSEARGTAILQRGRIVPVPLSPIQFITTPLLSLSGKLRLVGEPFVAIKTDGQDESLSAFATRRLGREASQHLIEPILAGIYSSDPNTQSVMTTASMLPELEKHGSLLKGMLAQGAARRVARKSGAPLPPRSFTFKRGAQTIVQALQTQLTGTLLTGSAVQRLERRPAWQAVLQDGTVIEADCVLLATQANVAARLLKGCAPDVAHMLEEIRHEGIASVTFVYRQQDINTPCTGLMIPRREQRQLDAITMRAAPRAKAGLVLVRAFVGGSVPELLRWDDAALHCAVRNELQDLLHITAAPIAHSTQRWLDCFPKPVVGHLTHVAQIEVTLPNGLALAGNSYRGIGVPDVMQSAERAIAQLAERSGC